MSTTTFTFPDPLELYSPEERARRIAKVWADAAVDIESRVRRLPDPLMADQLYNSIATSKYLNVPVRTLEGWRARGQGPAFLKLPNGSVKYRGSAVRRFIDEQGKHPRTKGVRS
ncbi:helix-turn-helix domain-containing protein [Falsihalocynthiibacter sp. S25ZX9]|uniref:helix-turn-helix domain-containing protein n=1 Tax=Falsihalocynthiibacter sp. S25ZX9 TaxID=3240870 RepID=UPI00350EA31C